MLRQWNRVWSLAGALTLASAPLLAQGVTLPRQSQHAVLTQTVGLTEITVDYHRPKVGEREIWGGLVPYDQVWRAGANENTTIRFSHDVTVEGEPLAAGTYGLHMIPGEEEWVVVFSRNHTSWGSFTYDQEEDALRVTVEPRAVGHREVLTYDVLDEGPESATLVLAWEKIEVPVRVAVDTHGIVLASLRDELRSVPGFTWLGWNQAAAYSLQNDLDLEEALGWVDTSIQREERFENLQTRSRILAELDRGEEAEELMARAMELANPLQLHNYARQLIAQGDPARAMEIFRLNAERNPDTWFIDIGLARGHSALGEFEQAAAAMRRGAEKAPEGQRAIYVGMAERLAAGEDVN